MTRLALVVNPKSGQDRDHDQIVRDIERAGAEVERVALQERERVIELQPDRVAVAGGDGSIACVAELAARLHVPLAVIPAGTANDFARVMELPLDLDEAAALAATGTHTRRLELGRANASRSFVNVASAGLAVHAARRASGWKAALGPVAYFAGAVDAGVRARPVEAHITCDDHELHEGPAWQIIVSSSGAFGAGSQIDEADPSDGKTDVTVVEAGSRVKLARRAHGLRTGRINAQPGVHHARGEVVTVTFTRGGDWNVDGEIVALGNARFEMLSDAYDLVTG